MGELSEHIRGGGSGDAINSVKPINHDRPLITDSNGALWAKSGSIIVDKIKDFPDATITSHMLHRPDGYRIEEKGGGQFPTERNYYGSLRKQQISTTGSLIWYPSGADVVETRIDGTLTGRKHLIGQTVKCVGYNHLHKSIVCVDVLGQFTEIVIDTGESLYSQRPIDWRLILPDLMDYSSYNPLSISFDGEFYLFTFSSREIVFVYYFDMQLNFILKREFKAGLTTTGVTGMVGGMDIDPISKTIFLTSFFTNSSNTVISWHAYDYNLNQIVTEGWSRDEVIGMDYFPPVFIRDYGILQVIGNYGIATIKTQNMIYTGRSATARIDAETMFADAGGFGWGLNPTKKTLFQYRGNKGNIYYTGINFRLDGIANVIMDFCGTPNSKLWVLDGDSLIREYNLNGVATGKTIELTIPARAMVTDGEYIYTFSYNMTPVQITKLNANGDVIEVMVRKNICPTFNSSKHLAFNGELWVAYDRPASCVFLDKEFYYVGNENFININSTTLRPISPNGYSILGNIAYTAAEYLFYSASLGRSFVPSVGLKNAAIDSASGLPIYARLK